MTKETKENLVFGIVCVSAVATLLFLILILASISAYRDIRIAEIRATQQEVRK